MMRVVVKFNLNFFIENIFKEEKFLMVLFFLECVFSKENKGVYEGMFLFVERMVISDFLWLVYMRYFLLKILSKF